jgi:uncharacterized protein
LNPTSAEASANDSRVQLLILSDGKPGHLNQSLAFARLLGCSYLVRTVQFRCRFFKVLSYLYDRIGIRTESLFAIERPLPACKMIVSAGSETYYANRVLASRNLVRSVVLMWPNGYRPSFDLIVAQLHDLPPMRQNLLAIPVNLSAPEEQGLVGRDGGKSICIAVIIGGPSRHYHLDAARLKGQLEQVFNAFPGGDFLVTTSRRTPVAVETLIDALPFRYRLVYSRLQLNPIPDFLAIADYVFITEDSTTMISEAVCYGKSRVEILSLEKRGSRQKVASMVESLSELGCLHRFDGTPGRASRKINLQQLLTDAVPAGWLAK